MYLLIRILVSIQKLFSCFCCHFNINAASTLKWAYLHFTKHYKFLETHRKSKVCTSRKRESKRGLLTGLNSISNSSKKHHQCFLKKYLFSTILSKAQKKASHKALPCCTLKIASGSFLLQMVIQHLHILGLWLHFSQQLNCFSRTSSRGG